MLYTQYIITQIKYGKSSERVWIQRILFVHHWSIEDWFESLFQSRAVVGGITTDTHLAAWSHKTRHTDNCHPCPVALHLEKDIHGYLLPEGGKKSSLHPHSDGKVKVAQSCLTLCNPMDYSVHGILQARILEWVAFPFSRWSSKPRDRNQVSRITGRFFTSWATREESHGKGKNGPLLMANRPLHLPWIKVGLYKVDFLLQIACVILLFTHLVVRIISLQI